MQERSDVTFGHVSRLLLGEGRPSHTTNMLTSSNKSSSIHIGPFVCFFLPLSVALLSVAPPRRCDRAECLLHEQILSPSLVVQQRRLLSDGEHLVDSRFGKKIQRQMTCLSNMLPEQQLPSPRQCSQLF